MSWYPGEIGIHITSKCNKNCVNCGLLRNENLPDYEIDPEDYLYSLSLINKDLKMFVITGGEPLTHPKFIDLLKITIEHFSKKTKIRIKTNGTNLEKFINLDFVTNNVLFKLSEYPGYNDGIAEKYSNHPGFFLEPFVGFLDPHIDYNRSDEDASKKFKNCHSVNKMRIINRRVYQCCLSEIYERTRNIENLSVELSDGWLNLIPDLKTVDACRYCFRPDNYLELRSGKSLPEKHQSEVT